MKVFCKFNIDDISTYRSELMGFAILWIMSFHFEFIQIKTFHYFTQFGYAGVEIFMLVSGLGIFYSLEKSKEVNKFYKRRFFRIIPIYYFLSIADSFFIFEDDIIRYLFRYSTIGYWIGSFYGDWFIPSIIMLYLTAPLLKKLFDIRATILLYLIIIIFLYIAYLLGLNYNYIDRAHYFFIYRIPAFIFGMLCAYWIKSEKRINLFFCLAVIGVPIFVYLFSQYSNFYYFKFYSFLFLLPTFTICLIILFRHNNKIINSTLAKIGSSSLEIYLIQAFFYHLYIYGFITIPQSIHDIIAIIFIIICSLGGILVHNLFANYLYSKQ